MKVMEKQEHRWEILCYTEGCKQHKKEYTASTKEESIDQLLDDVPHILHIEYCRRIEDK